MLIKLLISLYISAVLFFAGMAHAAHNPQIAMHSTQQLLPISFLDYDPTVQTLHIRGKVSNSCLQNFTPVIRLNNEQDMATLYVEAQYRKNCIALTEEKDFNVFINLNSLLTEAPSHNKLQVQLLNTVPEFGENTVTLNLDYVYHFDINDEIWGQLLIKNNRAFIVNEESKVEILTPFDLSEFDGQNIRLKGYTDSHSILPIGEEVSSKILFSQISLF